MTFAETDGTCQLYQIVPSNVFPDGPGIFSDYGIYRYEDAAFVHLRKAVALHGGQWKLLRFDVSPEATVEAVMGEAEQ